jgi:transcriptional regulator with XRE-family HTH domain
LNDVFKYCKISSKPKKELKIMSEDFGSIIRQARKEKAYSQRVLAKLIGMDFTYLSKLENNRADYPPKEDVIRSIAKELDLDQEELIYLAGRIPKKETALLKQYYKSMPALFKRIRENPEFAEQIAQEENK